MQALAPYREAVDIIIEAGGEPLKLCYQCGLCSGTCPWNLVRSFLVRRMMHEAQLGLVDFEAEEAWLCTTCRLCVERCPRGVSIIDVMRAVRRAIVGIGIGPIPDSLRITMKNISALGNPLGEEREKRADWAEGLDVKAFTPETKLLYFPCCIPAYDPRGKKIARATATILKKAEIDFGILGAEEACCGESVRKAGNEDLFQNLARSNIAAFAEKGVRKILATSPHCYNTFNNEYHEVGGDFEVVHYTQYFAQLIKEGRLKFSKQLNKRVAYHDPCYLGRHNGIYDEPREVLESIPGLELVEMSNSRENSLCCGGGGGRIWMETKKGERFSDLRIEQAIEAGAEVLVTACPYCILNFEDSVLTTDKGDILQIRDISELVLEAI
ncbi:MAG: Fe-S oxidoreductase [Chloroflexi bacterium]|nr:MAG: Fe-S oxidoreductase [Chloroflexota bacterium]